MAINNCKKFLFTLAVVLLIAGGFFVAHTVLAYATIVSVKINGTDNSSVQSGVPIPVTVIVYLTTPNTWKSTAYQFGDGSWTCIDTTDHEGDGTVSETFFINAPSKVGENNVGFEVYGNNDCTNNSDVAIMSASLLSAFINVFSSATSKIIILLLLTVIVVIFFVLYVVRRATDKRINDDINGKK
jgi:hypothetical protein